MKQSKQPENENNHQELLDKTEAILNRSQELQTKAAAQTRQVAKLIKQSEAVISHSQQLMDKIERA